MQWFLIPCRKHLICNNGVCSEGECWLHKDKHMKTCKEPGKKCFNKRCRIKCSEIHKSCPKVSVESIREVICSSCTNSCSHLCYKFWSKKLKGFAWLKKNNSLTDDLQIHSTLLDKHYFGKFFEITGIIHSNYERSEQFLKQMHF